MTYDQAPTEITWQEALAATNAGQRAKKIELLATEVGKLVDTSTLRTELEIALHTDQSLVIPVNSPEDKGKNAAEILVAAARRVRG